MSFEKWYANQVKHKKVNGEAPGKELKKKEDNESKTSSTGSQYTYYVEAVREAVIRQKDGSFLSPSDIPAKLDSELPQQALMAAFRKYRK